MTAALADPSTVLDGQDSIPEFSDMTPVAAPEPARNADPDAPYGRTRDGKPRGKPGPKKATTAKKTAPRKAAAASSSTRPTSSPPREPVDIPPLIDPDAAPGPRALALMKFMSLPLMGLGFAGYGMTKAYAPAHPNHRQGRALVADVELLGGVLPDLCQGLDEVAQTKPAGRLARFLDKVAEVSPYARLINALGTLTTQLAVNHGFIPANLARLVGAVDPDQLAEQGMQTLETELAAAAAAASR